MNENTLAYTMTTVSLIINILVLVPVSLILFTNSLGAEDVFGVFTPARGVLLSMYLSILIISLALLVKRDIKFVSAILTMQVVYKLTTPFTVGDISNPVVISNLLVSAFHIVTLWVVFRGMHNN